MLAFLVAPSSPVAVFSFLFSFLFSVLYSIPGFGFFSPRRIPGVTARAPARPSVRTRERLLTYQFSRSSLPMTEDAKCPRLSTRVLATLAEEWKREQIKYSEPSNFVLRKKMRACDRARERDRRNDAGHGAAPFSEVDFTLGLSSLLFSFVPDRFARGHISSVRVPARWLSHIG